MNQPYSLIPIALIILLLYFFSWGLAKTGEIRIINHRRFWNILLLLTFLVTGGLGILLIIQINYRIEAPWIKKVLKWHVDFGIALVCVALIHLWRHIRYYTDLFFSGKPTVQLENKNSVTEVSGLTSDYSKKAITGALIILGFTSILSQLMIIREFLCIFQGNELIIGMMLCIWMLLTAAGSKLGIRIAGKTVPERALPNYFLILSALPALIIILLYMIETQVFPPGTVKSTATAFIFCFCLLSPFCLMSGMLYTLLTAVLSGIDNKNRVSAAYAWESFGSMLAGLAFSLILVNLLGTFQILSLIMLICIVAQVMLLHVSKPALKYYWSSGIWILVAFFLLLSPVERWIRSLHYKNQELVYTKDTPYGNLSVTLTAGQYNYFENGNLLFSSENQIMQEEAVHFTLLQHSGPEKILIVSGGIAGMTKEALKYPSIERIDFLEINPWLVKAEMQFIKYPSFPGLRVIKEDARRWIKHIRSEYDAVLINTPDPSNVQINRYYTLEFFKEVKQALAQNGIFSIGLSPTANYMSSEAKEINSIIFHTLKGVFQHVVVIPGEKNYFIASDGNVHLDIAKTLQSLNIENDYVQPGYIEDDLLKHNSTLIMNEISKGKARNNQDLSPLAYFLQIRYWLSLFQNVKKAAPFILLIVLIILFFLRMTLRNITPVTLGIFAGGFAGASAEFLIIIVFQVLYGYLYQMLGLIIAFYMTGLMAGVFFGGYLSRRVTVLSYILVQIILFMLVILIPPLTTLVSNYQNIPVWTGQAILFCLTGVIACITGIEFNMASRLEKQSTAGIAGSLYGVDLTGAAAGTLLVSLVCLPVLGLQVSCLLAGLMIMTGFITMFVSASKYSIS